MFKNFYLEEFKIDLVKQYFSGKKKKDICQEYKVSKSTLWGWICKYGNLVQKDWKITEGIFQEGEFIDITFPIKEEIKKQTVINTTNESVRIFKNGYSIICHISKLDEVMRIIKND